MADDDRSITAYTPEDMDRFLREKLAPQEVEDLRWDWWLNARPSQLPPEVWLWAWLVIAGRGFGKNRLGAEVINWLAATGQHWRIALVARSAADVRDTMVEGESGLMNVSRLQWRPKFEGTKRKLTWPSGAVGFAYSSDEPDQLRGPQHDLAWADEISTWRNVETYTNLMYGLRLPGSKWLGTMTPKPGPLTRMLYREVEENPERFVVTRGTTFENLANLSESYRMNVVEKYRDTWLGRQELYAELLQQRPDALWKAAWFEREGFRVREVPKEGFRLIVIGVDPSGSDRESAAECGIVTVGMTADRRIIVLADDTLRATPAVWAEKVRQVYQRWGAHLVAAETNYGGLMVKEVLLAGGGGMRVEMVKATQGKRQRAEPVSLLYEKGQVAHLNMLPELESELLSWSPTDSPRNASPNRMDALVWACHGLPVLQTEPKYGSPEEGGTYAILCSRCGNVMRDCTCRKRR